MELNDCTGLPLREGLLIQSSLFAVCMACLSCGGSDRGFDAMGQFEADALIVSAEASGRLVEFGAQEGKWLAEDTVIGKIDPGQYLIQREQAELSVQAVELKTATPSPQVRVLEAQERLQREQLEALQIQHAAAQRERRRIDTMFAAGAATEKQKDDASSLLALAEQNLAVAKGQIELTRQQIHAHREQVALQNRGVRGERAVVESKRDAADDWMLKTVITNPVAGTVLTSYTHRGEWVMPGKALYKIADLRQMVLRAYIDGSTLVKVQLGQEVKIKVRYGDAARDYTGTITWISDEAEFTPKTIQTADERANLVYAIKVRVANDGYLKLGMYGELHF
ncbi:MAG: HlyD family efflux transporter periplasmic adaptor subunit [Saprospiraceae bacterium]|nr:HlyD family efflux transporter periplasmic adaptor subunit [Saprospiraceae bacterium]